MCVSYSFLWTSHNTHTTKNIDFFSVRGILQLPMASFFSCFIQIKFPTFFHLCNDLDARIVVLAEYNAGWIGMDSVCCCARKIRFFVHNARVKMTNRRPSCFPFFSSKSLRILNFCFLMFFAVRKISQNETLTFQLRSWFKSSAKGETKSRWTQEAGWEVTWRPHRLTYFHPGTSGVDLRRHAEWCTGRAPCTRSHSHPHDAPCPLLWR